MQKELKKLIKLAEDFREFSQTTTGRLSKYYCKNKVWCYFADDSDHSAIHFEDIEINFFNPVRITCEYKKLTVKILTDFTKKYRAKLEVLKSEFVKKTKAEIETEKLKRISFLKKRLAELEADCEK